MALGIAGIDITFKAVGDMSSYQYRAVYLSAANTVTVCGANGRGIGILQNKPDAANESAVIRVSGVSKCKINAAVTVGRFVESAASGLATIAATAGHYYYARALEAGSDQNDIITVVLAHGTIHADDT